MSNIGLKPEDGTGGKLVSYLEKELETLKQKIYYLEKRVKKLEEN